MNGRSQMQGDKNWILRISLPRNLEKRLMFRMEGAWLWTLFMSYRLCEANMYRFTESRKTKGS